MDIDFNSISDEDLKNAEKELEKTEKEFKEFLEKLERGEIEIDEEAWKKLKKETGYKSFLDENK
ncbi:MAG: hypothetical protein GX879_10945 [Bacteroidales bacterium]|jgi:predicted CopG family antitoxin|nr:hypothetical protein [Bacteroidales bacterium]